MKHVSVLIVEDDAKSRETMRLYVENAGWNALAVADGEEGLRLARERRPDVILLDLMLPRLDGLAVCAALRRESDAAIIMVTARAGEDDKLRGLDEGADDYVTKPFSPRELIARIRAILRRSNTVRQTLRRSIRGGELEIDSDSRTVLLRGKVVELTPTELRILSVLAEQPGRVYSRASLIDRALQESSEAEERTVDVHVRNLRRKIDTGGGRPFIATVFGAGYRLDP